MLTTAAFLAQHNAFEARTAAYAATRAAQGDALLRAALRGGSVMGCDHFALRAAVDAAEDRLRAIIPTTEAYRDDREVRTLFQARRALRAAL